MTIVVGRTQIHLGWEALIGLIIFTVTTTWMFSDYKHSQDNKLDKIIAWQKEHSTRDSIYYSKIDGHTADIVSLKKSNDSIRGLLSSTVRSKAISYYTARKINGRVVLTTVNN